MKLGLIGGAALMAALLTPFAVTVVGATAPAPRLADLQVQVPVGAVQTMRALEQARAAADAAPVQPAAPVAVQEEARPDAACARPVRVVGPTYGEPVLCRK